MEKKVSIIIPCLNEEIYIKNCITSLLENGYQKHLLELLIVDGMSTDKTREIINNLIKEHPQIKLIDNHLKKTPFALNLGITHATGDYILIASAHSAFNKDYISTLVETMSNVNADVVGGFMSTKIKNETKVSTAIRKVLSHPFGVGNSTFRTGTPVLTEVDTVPFGLYKSTLLKSVGGYNEKLIRNHDIELSKRLLAKGAKIILTPYAICSYYARETWSAIARNNYSNGKWNLRTVYITKDFSSLSLRHFIPLFFILSLITPLILSLFFTPFIYLSLISFLIYSCALIYINLKTDREGTSFLHLLYTFFTLHLSYGLGSLIGLAYFKDYFKK